MKISRQISQCSPVVRLLLLCLATSSFAADRVASTDFRKPDFFPVLPWDPFHGWDGQARDSSVSGLETIAECHFNFAGFVLPKDLSKCRKLSLAAILLPSEPEPFSKKYEREWRKLSDNEIERRVRAMVKAGGSNPAVKGYFITDEPGLNDFPALGKAVAAVKKYAPGKLAYINLFPDYATLGAPDMSQLGTSNYLEYLERFVAEVKPQVLSYDNYAIQYSDDLKKPEVAASYFRNLLSVRSVGQEHGLPCLQIVAANQLRPGHTVPSPANLSLQAYTTLASGFRGVTWYTYYSRGYGHGPVGPDGTRSMTWEWLREINRQVASLAPVLSRLSSTGVYFTSPPPAVGLPLLPGNMVESLTSTTPMMVGEFAGHERERYFMVVNLSLEGSANFKPQTKGSGEPLKEVSAVDGSLRALDPRKDGFWLVAGQGILLKAGD